MPHAPKQEKEKSTGQMKKKICFHKRERNLYVCVDCVMLHASRSKVNQLYICRLIALLPNEAHAQTSTKHHHIQLHEPTKS
jgi:hypothetical protein